MTCMTRPKSKLNYIYMKNIIIMVKDNKISKLQKLITWYLSGSTKIY